jgi:hypothetical protein
MDHIFPNALTFFLNSFMICFQKLPPELCRRGEGLAL